MTTLRLAGRCELQAGKKPPRLHMLAYGGSLMPIEGYGPVLIDLVGLKFSETIPILDGHENRLDAVIGAGKPEVRGGKLYITGTLAENEAARRLTALLPAGVVPQVSVGVSLTETRRLREGETIQANGRTHTVPKGGAMLVSKGVLREVSILPLGADPETEVSLAARPAAIGAQAMNDDTKDAASVAVDSERERMLGVLKATEGFDSIRARAISEGWTPEFAEREVLRARAERAELEALRTGRPTPPGVRGRATPDVQARHMLLGSLLHRTGYAALGEKYLGEIAMEAAANLRAHSLVELFAAGLLPKI